MSNRMIAMFIGLNILDAGLTTYLISKGESEINWWNFVMTNISLFWTLKIALAITAICIVLWIKQKNYKRLNSSTVSKLLNAGMMLIVATNVTSLVMIKGGIV